MSQRSFSSLALVASLIASLVVRASAQAPLFAPEFASAGTDAPVHALASFDDGGGAALYAGGRFSRAGGVDAEHAARWNGSTWSRVGALDGTVNALCVFDDGSGPALYAGGAFTHDASAGVARIARWNGASWSPLAGGFDDGAVYALASFDDGGGARLVAGGTFTSASGTPVARLASWNGTNWEPIGGSGGGIDPLSGFSVNLEVRALCAHDDGGGTQLYVGGTFQHAGSVAIANLARWNGAQWSAVGGDMTNTVFALATYAEGASTRLAAGGLFTQNATTPARYLCSWDGSGWSSVGAYAQGQVRSLTAFDDGGGSALYAGSVTGATVHEALHRWRNGTWTSFASTQDGGRVLALAGFDDGSGAALFHGGEFVQGSYNYLGRLKNDAVEGFGPSRSIDGAVSMLASFDAGHGDGAQLYAGGNFQHAGFEAIRHVASWNGSQWRTVPPGGGLPNAPVNALRAHTDANGTALFVGGFFTAIGGVAANHVARFDGAQWSALGAGLDDSVADFATFDDGSGAGPLLYACGAFHFSGATPVTFLARWDGSTWSIPPAAVPPINGAPSSMAVFDDGSGPALYLAGDIGVVGTPNGRGIARWDGHAWSTLNGGTAGGGQNGLVSALTVFDDGTGDALYVAGGFTSAGGVAAAGMARWNGAQWSSVGGGLYGATTLAGYDDGNGPRLYAGGAFQIGGSSFLDLARLNGGVWEARAPSFPYVGGRTYALLVYDDGAGRGPALYLGGAMRITDPGTASPGFLDATAVLRGTRIESFCAGDGLDPQQTTPCPCSNFGAAGHGCAWHANADGALLSASGRIQPDELVLTASQMPATSPTTVFWKADASSTSAVPWGDGLRCIDGNLLRLGTKNNVGGVARYPETGNASISVRGHTPVGSGQVGYYQTSFRNAANFCTPATFNATNGVRVVW